KTKGKQARLEQRVNKMDKENRGPAPFMFIKRYGRIGDAGTRETFPCYNPQEPKTMFRAAFYEKTEVLIHFFHLFFFSFFSFFPFFFLSFFLSFPFFFFPLVPTFSKNYYYNITIGMTAKVSRKSKMAMIMSHCNTI